MLVIYLNGVRQKEIMKLWHPSDRNDFKLSEGHVDHSKSEYCNDDKLGIKEAYPKLWELIKVPDGQIIWCYTRKENIPKTSTPRFTSTLEVPEDSWIRYIDDIKWNQILGIPKVHLTLRYSRPIKDKANDKFPNDPQKWRDFENELEDEFWENKPPAEELWKNLFLEKPDEDGSSALLKHPILAKWIIRSETIQCR